MANSIVVKISGHELDDPAYLAAFARVLAGIDAPKIIVHGGGKTISTMQTRLGIEPRYADGVRITDADSLAIVEMVLRGSVNTALVRALIAAGLEAQGMSGVDRGLIRAEKMHHAVQDMGFTGVVTAVRADVLRFLLEQGIIPVIAPVCLGETSTFNVNADQAAGAVASALDAHTLYLVSNVPGVLVDGQLARALTPEQVAALIENGTIFGGMIPKVRSALDALANGAKRAVITDLNGLRAQQGTVFAASA
ncbi:MAG: acetylglutamate kinase [bacterium]|nr:acetylglutamate kinase [bacterium]